MKCHAKGCQNDAAEGRFSGVFCWPCYSAMTDGKAEHGTSWIFTQTARLAEAERLLREMAQWVPSRGVGGELIHQYYVYCLRTADSASGDA